MSLLATLGPALLGVGAQVGSTLLGDKMQQKADNRAYQRNLDFYNIQRQDALADWRLQADYNDPSAQMQRLTKAGISPYAMSGNAVLAGGMQSQPRASTGSAPPAYQVNSAQNVLSSINAISQMKAVQAQTEKTKAETDAIKQQFAIDQNTKLPLAMATLENQWADLKTKSAALDTTKAQLSSILEDVTLKKTQNLYENQFLKGRNELQSSMAIKLKSEITHIKSQIDNLSFQNNKLLPQQVREIQARIQQLEATTAFQQQMNVKQGKLSNTDEAQRWIEMITKILPYVGR